LNNKDSILKAINVLIHGIWDFIWEIMLKIY
jgi:hypothetical protein